MKLSEIKTTPVSKLKRNPDNDVYFRAETGKYFRDLRADIEKRGILVPLVARRDGTLLAGHNRLLVAKQIGMKSVPVQFITGKMSAEQEREFMIKDNVLRRHLEAQERQALYRMIIKDLDDKLMITMRGKDGNDMIDIPEVARKAGLPKETVKQDFKRMRKQRQAQLSQARTAAGLITTNEKALKELNRAISKALNLALVEQTVTVDAFMEAMSTGIERLRTIKTMHESKAVNS